MTDESCLIICFEGGSRNRQQHAVRVNRHRNHSNTSSPHREIKFWRSFTLGRRGIVIGPRVEMVVVDQRMISTTHHRVRMEGYQPRRRQSSSRPPPNRPTLKRLIFNQGSNPRYTNPNAYSTPEWVDCPSNQINCQSTACSPSKMLASRLIFIVKTAVFRFWYREASFFDLFE